MPFDSNQRWIPPDDNWRTGQYFRIRVSGIEGKPWKYLEPVSAADADGTLTGGKQWSWDEIFHNQDTTYVDHKGNLKSKEWTPKWDTKSSDDKYISDLKGMIEKGWLGDVFPTQYGSEKNKSGNYIDADLTLNNMFNTSQWNAENDKTGQMRFEVLRQFQDHYYGTETMEGIYYDEELREDPNGGLDIQREWMIGGDDAKKVSGKESEEVFQQLMGLDSDGQKLNKYFEFGSKADFRYVNKADKAVLNSMRQHVFGDNYHQDYTTVEEIRQAKIAHSKQTLDERDRLTGWANKFITPYKDYEELKATGDKKYDKLAWEFHKSMKFDPETNTMTYYDPFVGHAKVDKDGNPVTRTIEPPAEPEVMDIRVGPTVQKLHDSDGNRIVNESSVNELYHRYLGRASDPEGLNYWMNEGHSFNAIEKYLRDSPEGQANKAKWLDPNDKLYFNPQKYGSPESITARMRDEPAKIKAPAITIRNIGQPKKPIQSYMKLPSHWLTEAPVKVPAVTRDDTTKIKITPAASLGAML